MPKKISLAIVALLCLVPLAIAEEQTKTSGAETDQQLLHDLSRIREKLGGSVLSGSVLDPGDEDRDAAFQEGVQSLLEKTESEQSLTPTPKSSRGMLLPKVSKAMRFGYCELNV